MLTAKEFSRAVLSELRKAGWSGRGKTVWARCGDGDVCVDLQKSNYDETVFVNVGVTLHALGNAKGSKYTDCHLQFRVERLLDGFPGSMTDDFLEIQTAVKSKEPELRALGELGELRKRAAAGGLGGGLVCKEAREMLATRG